MALKSRVPCLIAAMLLCLAIPAGSQASADPPAAQVEPVAPAASLGHSGVKYITYEIGNTINNFIFLSTASGLAGGALLTAFNTMQSWTVYSVNDYVWENIYPKQITADGSFDAGQSFWHTSLKYLTGKPIVATIKIAAISLYTGSIATGVTYGLAATAGASVVFFVNNLAWDYYDQWTAPRTAVATVNAAR